MGLFETFPIWRENRGISSFKCQTFLSPVSRRTAHGAQKKQNNKSKKRKYALHDTLLTAAVTGGRDDGKAEAISDETGPPGLPRPKQRESDIDINSGINNSVNISGGIGAGLVEQPSQRQPRERKNKKLKKLKKQPRQTEPECDEEREAEVEAETVLRSLRIVDYSDPRDHAETPFEAFRDIAYILSAVAHRLGTN